MVDSNTLSWAYLEAGTIQTIGCLFCFFFAVNYHYGISFGDVVANSANWTLNDFTSSGNVVISSGMQTDALAVGQSAYYISLMIQQSFNLFICKARLALPFGKFMFTNPKNFYGVFGGAILSFALVYIPPLNQVFGTNYILTPYVWLIAAGFGLVNFIYSILRFMVNRLRNPTKFIKDVQGLDLHPTRFSTGR